MGGGDREAAALYREISLRSGRASHLLFTVGRMDALRAADMPTLLAIRDTIRQVR